MPWVRCSWEQRMPIHREPDHALPSRTCGTASLATIEEQRRRQAPYRPPSKPRTSQPSLAWRSVPRGSAGDEPPPYKGRAVVGRRGTIPRLRWPPLTHPAPP
jgi:hypothetical protein